MLVDSKPRSLHFFFDENAAMGLLENLKALRERALPSVLINATRSGRSTPVGIVFFLTDRDDEFYKKNGSSLELYLSLEMLRHAMWKLDEFMSNNSFSTPEFCEFHPFPGKNTTTVKCIATYFMPASEISIAQKRFQST